MNTEKLFITRKRKKWKFAHFNQWPNCFQAEHVTPDQWPSSLIVEVGAGTADLSVALAKQQPNDTFVALDIKSDRLYTGAKYCLHQGITNISFVRGHVNQISELFQPQSIKELWITFPDPFERKKHAKHRLTHPNFLKQYQKLLAPDGLVHFKTDNRQLFLWSLEQLVAEKWRIVELSFDLHQSDLPQHYKITTHYERIFMAQDVSINYLTARPPGLA